MIQAPKNNVKPTEPWRQRLIRSLLYGRNVDRSAKARARVGFAILAFAAIYAVIGGRLVMIATGDNHAARRTASQDRIATARPDIVDRNGVVLATDVKSPSLFGEPRRIIDKDEAIELLTATLPDLDTGEVRERLLSKKGFVWLKREITPKQQYDIHRLGIPGIGFLRENKRVYPTGAEVAHLIGLVNIDNQGIAGMEKWLDNNGLADLHRAGFATDRLQRPVELSIDLRVEHALRDEQRHGRGEQAVEGREHHEQRGEVVTQLVEVRPLDGHDRRTEPGVPGDGLLEDRVVPGRVLPPVPAGQREREVRGEGHEGQQRHRPVDERAAHGGPQHPGDAALRERARVDDAPVGGVVPTAGCGRSGRNRGRLCPRLGGLLAFVVPVVHRDSLSHDHENYDAVHAPDLLDTSGCVVPGPRDVRRRAGPCARPHRAGAQRRRARVVWCQRLG